MVLTLASTYFTTSLHSTGANLLTTYHVVTTYLLILLYLTIKKPTVSVLFFFIFSVASSYLWFFYVFIWSLGYLFLVSVYSFFFKSSALLHKKTADLAPLLLIGVLLTNVKGDHSWASILLYSLKYEMFLIIKHALVPVTWLQANPVLTFFIFVSFIKKKHAQWTITNFFLKVISF